MKKVITIAVASLFIATTTETAAQTFGAKVGFNMANMHVADDDNTYSEDFSMKPGFHVGGSVFFPVNDAFSVGADLLFSTKGYKFSDEMEVGGSTLEMKQTLNLNYLDIPITARYAFELNSDLAIFGAVGPYVGIGLSGTSKNEVTFDGDTESETEDVEWGSDPEEGHMLKRLDFGGIVSAGVLLNEMIEISVNYNYGLANIASYTENGSTASNRVLSLSVGYRFGN